MQRLEPVSPPYDDHVTTSFGMVMPPNMQPLNLFRTLAHNPRVLRRMARGGLLDRGSISLAERELVILRTCALLGAEYEWGVHVAAFGGAAKFTQAQIADTCAESPNPELWSEKELLLLLLVQELQQTAQVPDSLWEKLAAVYAPNQLIELVMLVGLYHAVGFTVNALNLEKEAFAPKFIRE